MAAIVPTDDQVFITPADLRKRYGNYGPNIFKSWQDKDLVRKLRNGMYVNATFKTETRVDKYMIANEIYAPSYVSLYSALSYYSLIPEHVIEVISVSTKKTKYLFQDGSRYRFHTIKPELFWGYENVPWRGSYYSIAYPEKALLDLAYLEPLFSDSGWIEEMRFDRWGIKEDIDWDRLILFAHQFKSEIVMQRIGLLLEIISND